MSGMESQCCPECRSALVDDEHNGEVICSCCGIVVTEQTEYHGPDASMVDEGGLIKNTRTSGHVTYAMHDLGMTTEISIGGKDFSGKAIGRKVASQVKQMRMWQQRVRVTSAKDRRLTNVLMKIGEICRSASLPENVVETAAMAYRDLDDRLSLRCKSISGVAMAVTYMACKRCDVVRSITEMCMSTYAPDEEKPGKEIKAKAKLAARYYREMVMEAGQYKTPAMSLGKYIAKISNMTNTDARVERLALEMAEKTEDSEKSGGKSPSGIAAAYLYVASILMGQPMVQREVSAVAGVTDITIRNRCKEMLAGHRLKIVLRPSLARRRTGLKLD